jgi:Methyltransferase domain
MPPQADRCIVPYPRINLCVDNPIQELVSAPEFVKTGASVSKIGASKRALISTEALALFYALVRNVRPRHVVEIGTYNAGTSELICQALLENGFGLLHTVGPFDAERVIPILDSWSPALLQHLRFYPMTSMEFYYEMSKLGISPEIAFVDGDHSYETALFDIQSLAKSLARGGFLLVDNVSQAGPYYAAMDFLALHAGWTRCKIRDPKWADSRKAFDRERTSIPETDFEILRSPRSYSVTARPVTFGEFLLQNAVSGLRIKAATAGGVLYAQCVLRGFGPSPVETVTSATVDISAPGTFDILFPQLFAIGRPFTHCTAEPWLSWTGATPLSLFEIPTIISPNGMHLDGTTNEAQPAHHTQLTSLTAREGVRWWLVSRRRVQVDGAQV